MMALAEAASQPHGPLALLLTVVEEVGGETEGASALDRSLVSGRTLLNLDSEEDGKLTIGSASSTNTSIQVEMPREPCQPGTTGLAVAVSGGLGGHSGTDIARGHANAIKVLARALRETLALVPFQLVAFEGGRSWNAIPRDATAICCLPSQREAAFRAAVESAATTIRDGYAGTDPDVTITVSGSSTAADAWPEDATRNLLDVVVVTPNGPLAVSSDFQGLVETSTSLDEVITDGRTLTLHHLSRSSNDSLLPDVIAALDAAAALAGGRFTIDQADPAWRPNLDSHALAVTQRVYTRLFGDAPDVTAVHAWLETAVIGDRVGGLDMISFGPQIEAPHSPGERVNIPSVERFWRLLVAVVDELSLA
jgi:dipeptidase D